jgi:hypothetical protein
MMKPLLPLHLICVIHILMHPVGVLAPATARIEE